MCQKIVLIGIIKNMLLKLISNILLIILISTQSLAQENLLNKLDNAYKSIIDAHGRFVQTSFIKDLDKIQKFNGRFFIKGDKIRWQYEGEYTQVIFLNKENLIIYDKSKKQAIQSSFTAERYGQLPLALLSRISIIERDFEIFQKSEKTLLLIPKIKMGNIKRIEIDLHNDNFPIKTMKITDLNENTVKIDFQSVKTNKNLRESIFKFTPAKDDTIINY